MYLNTASCGLPPRDGFEAMHGAQPVLELVNRIGVTSVYEHDVALANRFRAGLGMDPANSAIVSVAGDGAGVPPRQARMMFRRSAG